MTYHLPTPTDPFHDAAHRRRVASFIEHDARKRVREYQLANVDALNLACSRWVAESMSMQVGARAQADAVYWDVLEVLNEESEQCR